jgi:hypothetical protein
MNDKDEPAEVAGFGVGLKHHGARQFERAHTNIVELELLGREVFQRVDVHPVLQRCHGGADRLRPDLHDVGSALQHRPLVHPDDGRLELIGDGRWGGSGCEHIAAADVDVIGERDRDGLAGDGTLEVPAGADDAGDVTLSSRREHAHGVPHPYGAADNEAREAAEVGVRPVHPLDRQAKWLRP